MAEPKVALRNIRSIGTIDDPVEVIHVKIIQQLENLSHELSTMGVGTETFAGQTFNTGTNAITHVSNVTSAGTFTTTGAAQINSTLGVTGTATMAAITASGLITANGGVTLGGNMTTGVRWIRGSGGNVGQKFTGADVEFSGQINAKNTGNYSLNATGNVRVSGNLSVIGSISSNSYISSTGYIDSSSTISATSFVKGSYLKITDGISAPATEAGITKIYTDSGDGDLKVKFGNGFVAVLAADS